MERYYTTNLTYVGAVLPNMTCRNDLTAFYTFSLPAAKLAQRTFSVEAAPQGQQASKDTKCGTLAIDQIGAKSASGSGGVAECWRSEEHTSELQSLMRISYAVFCLKKKNNKATSSQSRMNHQPQVSTRNTTLVKS